MRDPTVRWIVFGSVAVLGVAGALWLLFPRLRPAVATAVVLSPVPPIP